MGRFDSVDTFPVTLLEGLALCLSVVLLGGCTGAHRGSPEMDAVKCIESLHGRESTFLTPLKLYGTLDELQNAFDAAATRQFERCAEYQLYISAPQSKYFIGARPLSGRGAHQSLFSDQTRVIRDSCNGDSLSGDGPRRSRPSVNRPAVFFVANGVSLCLFAGLPADPVIRSVVQVYVPEQD